MALATRCPHCNTTFRVVEDQLKLYSGVVRCGVCHEIFNASDHIVDDSVPAKDEQPPQAPAGPASIAPSPPQANRTQDPSRKPSPAVPANRTEDTPDTAIPATEPVPPPAPPAPPIPSAPPQSVAFVAPEPAKEPAAPPKSNSFAEATETDNDDRIELDIPEQPFNDSTPAMPYPMEIDDLSIEDLSEKIIREGKYDPMAAEGLQTFENTASRLHEEDWQSISLELGDQPEKESASLHPEATPGIPAPTSEPIAPAAFEPHPADHAPADIPVSSPVEPVHESTAAEPDLDLSNVAAPEHDAEVESQSKTKRRHEPGFVKRARRRQRSSKAMRWLLSLGSLILLAVLALQGVYAFHDRIIALVPQAEPAVAEICGILDCETRLTTKIDDLSIDSNELQSLPNQPDTYKLDVLLRNLSSSTQEWPHLELTLNDESGQPAIRRVFIPETYLADLPPSANASVSKGFAPQSEQQIKLVFTLDKVKAAGYRVYIFYP